jgi:hypothetical protein
VIIIVVVLVLVLEGWCRAGVDFAHRIHQSLSTESTPRKWLTRTFEDEGDDEDEDDWLPDDGLPDAVHTEINQAGANQSACNQKNPIYGLNGQVEQDYNYS